MWKNRILKFSDFNNFPAFFQNFLNLGFKISSWVKNVFNNWQTNKTFHRTFSLSLNTKMLTVK